jgi:hypothetical protein
MDEYEEFKNKVAFKLGDIAVNDDALMEVLGNGQAELVTHLINTVIDLTMIQLREEGMLK